MTRFDFVRDRRGTFQELRLDNCSELQELHCCSHQLTSLDISKCTALTTLFCYRNQLISLDVSKCIALLTLVCFSNRLTSLDVSRCTALTTLLCSSNQLSASALNALFNSLPTRNPDENAIIIYHDNPGYKACNETIAIKKGWTAVVY